MRIALYPAVLLFCAACAAEDAASNGLASACQIAERATPLPEGLGESSGLAIGRSAAGVLWTHNDSGNDPVVYAVTPEGRMAGEVRVRGAENRDWEDIALGPCAAGGSCLYIADIGDNDGKRDDVDIYRLPELPGAASESSAPTERFRVRYPGGPRDAEALFVLPSGEVHIVTKGRRESVEVFRYPLPLRAGETVELERVATLHPEARGEVMQVTGADASPDGAWVAVRTYGSLMLFRSSALLAGDSTPALVVDLGPLAEAQGEAVALADDGTVILGSEGGGRRAPATMARLTCSLPD